MAAVLLRDRKSVVKGKSGVGHGIRAWRSEPGRPPGIERPMKLLLLRLSSTPGGVGLRRRSLDLVGARGPRPPHSTAVHQVWIEGIDRLGVRDDEDRTSADRWPPFSSEIGRAS